MRKVSRLQDKQWSVVFPLIGLLIVVADQFSKVWIRINLPEGYSLFQVGFFRITHIHNTGAAFGLFRDQSFALTIVAIIAITVILVYTFVGYRHLPWLDTMSGKLALGLILGGTVGNLIDRLRFGYVTDFIDFRFWPAFNIADSAVTVGVTIFVVSLLFLSPTKKQ